MLLAHRSCPAMTLCLPPDTHLTCHEEHDDIARQESTCCFCFWGNMMEGATEDGSMLVLRTLPRDSTNKALVHSVAPPCPAAAREILGPSIRCFTHQAAQDNTLCANFYDPSLPPVRCNALAARSRPCGLLVLFAGYPALQVRE